MLLINIWSINQTIVVTDFRTYIDVHIDIEVALHVAFMSADSVAYTRVHEELLHISHKDIMVTNVCKIRILMCSSVTFPLVERYFKFHVNSRELGSRDGMLDSTRFHLPFHHDFTERD